MTVFFFPVCALASTGRRMSSIGRSKPSQRRAIVTSKYPLAIRCCWSARVVDGRGKPVVLFKSHYRANLYFYTINLPKMRKLPTRAKRAPKRRRVARIKRAAAGVSRPASRPIPSDQA